MCFWQKFFFKTFFDKLEFREEAYIARAFSCHCLYECEDDDNIDAFSPTYPSSKRRSSEGCSLSSLRAIQKFQSFLVGTTGETFWNLWLDIERARLLSDHAELTRYVRASCFFCSFCFIFHSFFVSCATSIFVFETSLWVSIYRLFLLVKTLE